MKTHTMACRVFSEDCSCGASEFNNLTDKLTKATTALADARARVKELEALLKECAPALDDNYVLGWAPTLPERIRAADRSAMATKKD